jgi:hypothetical protein
MISELEKSLFKDGELRLGLEDILGRAEQEYQETKLWYKTSVYIPQAARASIEKSRQGLDHRALWEAHFSSNLRRIPKVWQEKETVLWSLREAAEKHVQFSSDLVTAAITHPWWQVVRA